VGNIAYILITRTGLQDSHLRPQPFP